MSINIDDEWQQYISQTVSVTFQKEATKIKKPQIEVPASTTECEELYISTKTKVLFLNAGIDIHSVFWNIPILEYSSPKEGVIKKQMKIVSKTPEEFEEYRQKIEGIQHYSEHIIKQINNPTARRLKFKDERKITVGISKKDIMNCRGKVKNAFYNCFAMILRIRHPRDGFREIHVKIFNTGKMEIPGIPDVRLLEPIKVMILDILRPHQNQTLDFLNNENEDSVLINSNFNCGFFVNREKLYTILRNKYRIESAYEPCSYPGVKCKFYFNNVLGFDEEKQTGHIELEDQKQKRGELTDNKKYTEVSFMIFRTGSCLIVGNCTEPILRYIFGFIKGVLMAEYQEIWTATEDPVQKNKKSKIRKKTVFMTQKYYQKSVLAVGL